MLFPPLYFHDLDFITKLNKSETMNCLIKVQQGWLGGWVVGWLDRWSDGWTDGWTFIFGKSINHSMFYNKQATLLYLYANFATYINELHGIISLYQKITYIIQKQSEFEISSTNGILLNSLLGQSCILHKHLYKVCPNLGTSLRCSKELNKIKHALVLIF